MNLKKIDLAELTMIEESCENLGSVGGLCGGLSAGGVCGAGCLGLVCGFACAFPS